MKSLQNTMTEFQAYASANQGLTHGDSCKLNLTNTTPYRIDVRVKVQYQGQDVYIGSTRNSPPMTEQAVLNPNYKVWTMEPLLHNYWNIYLCCMPKADNNLYDLIWETTTDRGDLLSGTSSHTFTRNKLVHNAVFTINNGQMQVLVNTDLPNTCNSRCSDRCVTANSCSF